jgi:hypothetical protein
VPNLGANFYPKLVQISSEVGMKPEDLLAVMVSESGINPQAVEKKFHGSGLVGFMPDTLKGLGFKGTWEDFIKLSGEEQLDYVKKLVQGFSKTNGGPFTSAGQYYVANLWPVALKLPGIKQGNPATRFIEKDPEVVTEPGTGKKYSKKYYDIGIKIDPGMEASAYKYNPLFDKDHKGAITYGDMMKQVEINKQNPAYQKALVAMRDTSGYTPGKQEPSMVATKDDKEDIFSRYLNSWKGKDQDDVYSQLAGKPAVPGGTQPAANINGILDEYLQQVAASEKFNRKLYKQFLPINHLVIQVKAQQFTDSVEFARVLCTALDEELMARAFTHTDGHDVEIDCAIPGPEDDCVETVKQLTAAIADAFCTATSKIGGIKVKTDIISNKKSSYQQIKFKTANLHYRKFLLKFI